MSERTSDRPKRRYFGVHGTLEGYAPGLFIIEAPNSGIARAKLVAQHSPMKETRFRWPLPIEGKWAETLRDIIDIIRNREKGYYVDLGNGVFYVEV